MSVSIDAVAGAATARRAASLQSMQRDAAGIAVRSAPSPVTTTCRRSGHSASDRVEQREALGRRHQHAHVAVAQDVADLLGLEQRIERHEHAAGRGRAERRDHGFEALVEIDADAFGAGELQRAHRVAERAYPTEKGFVVERFRAESHGPRVRISLCRARDQVGQQVARGHRSRRSSALKFAFPWVPKSIAAAGGTANLEQRRNDIQSLGLVACSGAASSSAGFAGSVQALTLFNRSRSPGNGKPSAYAL